MKETRKEARVWVGNISRLGSLRDSLKGVGVSQTS